MKAAFAKTVIGLVFLGLGSVIDSASAHDRDEGRGGKHNDRYEQRGWERHDKHPGWRKNSHARPYYRQDRHHSRGGYGDHKGGGKDGVTIIFRGSF